MTDDEIKALVLRELGKIAPLSGLIFFWRLRRLVRAKEILSQ